MKHDMRDVDFANVEGLHYYKSAYYVFDEFNNLIPCVCPFCYSKQHLINILTPDPQEFADGVAVCSLCERRFNLKSWEFSDEAKQKLKDKQRKDREKEFCEAVLKQSKKEQCYNEANSSPHA